MNFKVNHSTCNFLQVNHLLRETFDFLQVNHLLQETCNFVQFNHSVLTREQNGTKLQFLEVAALMLPEMAIYNSNIL